MSRHALTSFTGIKPVSVAENERLTRIGRGTAMGEVMRRYWMPACLASEIPQPDDPPVRVRLLGENLVAFRDTSGAVGLVDALCAHRRAPLFFGRNEECGLRCVYHGWKYDTTGQCVDLPSEPEFSHMRQHARIKAYPTYEAGGLIWTYMGPIEHQPPVPDYEWLRIPSTHFKISKVEQACNYLQGIEGGIDTAHSSFLHNEDLSNNGLLRNRDRHPELDVEITEYGFRYVGIRNISEEQSYIRGYQFIMPVQKLQGAFLTFAGTPSKVECIYGHCWVPADDEHTIVYSIRYSRSPQHGELTAELFEEYERHTGRGKEHFVPGTFRLIRNLDNDFLIDREMQRTKTFTGIAGVNTQDVAIQEGMGPIEDRSEEYLGTTDKAIVACRQLLLEAADEVEAGIVPRGVEPEVSRDVRGADLVAPKGVPWQDVMKDALMAVW
jgi:phenylpropionate dioxygenase-like ring-hydroxylating dioxygenase large terminal subunit